MNSLLLKVYSVIFIPFYLLSLSPVQAQSCMPLNLVGGEGSQVTKTVSQPTIEGFFGVQITRNNWNTDWEIPLSTSPSTWQSFMIELTSDKEQSLNVRAYLKYPDQTADEFFNDSKITVSPEKPLKITLTPRDNTQPYQVNIFVGDVASLGKTYTVSASGCR